MTLNGKEINADTVIDKHGSYTLVITGEGGYTETITFKYSNPNISLTLFILIPVLLAVGAAVLVIFLKRRRVV